MTCTHHCILDFCGPQSVATYIDDVVHPPRDLVIAALSSVSPISREVVACTIAREFSASTSELGPSGAPFLP